MDALRRPSSYLIIRQHNLADGLGDLQNRPHRLEAVTTQLLIREIDHHVLTGELLDQQATYNEKGNKNRIKSKMRLERRWRNGKRTLPNYKVKTPIKS